MATYNKRGYKLPKEKAEKGDEYIEDDVMIDETESTTAGVFSKLDEGASKTEEWVAKNQKYILIILGAIALLTVGYVVYQKFVAEPKETEAANEMFVAQQNFQQAIDGVASDSLFNLALNGADGKLGFIQIAEQYSGTDAGNLANYYAGVSFLHIGKYVDAIKYLDEFKADSKMLDALAKGAIGDAFAQRNQLKEAAEYYVKAADVEENEFTRPRFLLKAGQVQLALGNKADALKNFTEIKEKYMSTPEGATIDAMIGLAQ